MVCIFCGQDRKSSTEHVIPKWTGPLLSALPPTGLNPGGKRMTHRFTPSLGDDTPGREWHAEGPALTTKAVCLGCNNGWLGDLETKASRAFGSLVLDEPALLPSSEQQLIATWSYKTVLLLQMIRPKSKRPIPQERFAELYRLGRPPADVRIWLATPVGSSAMHEASTEIKLVARGIEVPGFFTVLALGHLLILCAGRLVSGPERFRVGSNVDPASAISVWPASIRSLHWPPVVPLEDLRPKSLVALL